MKKTKRMILKDPFPLNFLEMLVYETNLDLPEEITNDIRCGIKFALSSLSGQERDFIKYRYQYNKTYAEIASLSYGQIENFKNLGPKGKSITAYALYRLGLEHTAWNCY